MLEVVVEVGLWRGEEMDTTYTIYDAYVRIKRMRITDLQVDMIKLYSEYVIK